MLWSVVGLQFLAFQRIILPSTSGSCSLRNEALSDLAVHIYRQGHWSGWKSYDGVWSVAWGHGALAAGSEGRLSFIWGSHGHISFWSGGIHCSKVQFIRHAVYSSRLLEYLQNTGLYPQKTSTLMPIFPIHVPCFSMHPFKQFESLMISWNKIFQLHLMTFLHYFSPCLTTILDIASSVLIHQLLSLITKIMHQVQIHEGIFSFRCSQTNHILQSKSRLPDTCIETLFYLTTVVSHFTVSLLHLTIPPNNTKLVCYVWSESVSQKRILPASSFNEMSKTPTSAAIYRSKPHGPQAHSKM